LGRHVDLPIAGATAGQPAPGASSPQPAASTPPATVTPTPAPAVGSSPAHPAPAVSKPPQDHDVTVIEKATATVEDGPTEILRQPGAPS
jgi:hypothetical protein